MDVVNPAKTGETIAHYEETPPKAVRAALDGAGAFYLPFGGVRKSGFGRELSRYGIREFVNVKSVQLD